MLTAVMMVVEVVVGIRSGSMALLADGLHMASHTVAIGLAAFAYGYARRHATDQRFSFGTGKVNSLAGFTGALLLAMFALLMASQSVDRFINPVGIAFDLAIGVAVVGLLVNGASALILGGVGAKDADGDEHDHSAGHHQAHHGHSHGHQDHNLRSAYLHVLADAVTSMAAIAALITGKYLGWTWMDPMMGIAGSLVVIYWAKGLIRDSGKVLLDYQAPTALVESVRSAIEADSDNRVTDIHIWGIGPARYAAVLGVVTHSPQPVDHYRGLLAAEFGIAHATVEVHQCADEDGTE
jgi:cation diffusion facilitator family transporter